MEQNKDIVLGVLKRIFGNPKTSFSNQIQFEFNCPSSICKNDKNKFNLNFNSDKIIFHCFKCGYHGVIHSLIAKYGTKEDVQRVNLIYPRSAHQIYNRPIIQYSESNAVCELPTDYRSLTKKYDSKYYYRAMKYLEKRKVTPDIIKKYELGYTEDGNRKFRIIVPSRNNKGKINYYDARSFFTTSKTPYLKPDFPNKLDIIFNENNINFDLPVYVVEGVFDMFPLNNCIPLLGKDLSPYLLMKFLKHKTKIILCLDEDAIKDTIRIYNELTSYGLDAYIVEVKGDIAKYYELYGKEKLIELIGTYKKPDFIYLYKLKLDSKKLKKKLNSEQLSQEIDNYKRQIKEEEDNEQ